MGILAEPLQFIRGLNLPRGFSVCELGDQWITCEGEHRLARDFYVKDLGCSKYVSIDGNGRGTVTADLNIPLLKQGFEDCDFDLVTDFGTGEHVFNQQQIWHTLHDLTKVDGFIVFDRPSDGYEGHCFYLVQWNLVSALAHANCYEVVRLEEYATVRGILLRGVLRKRVARKFIVPQQGRYYKDLVIDRKSRRRGAEYKSQELRVAGVVGRRK